MKWGDKPKPCPNGCKAEPHFVRTPTIIHYGKMICSQCGRFIDWVGKPPPGTQTKPTSELAIGFWNHDPL